MINKSPNKRFASEDREREFWSDFNLAENFKPADFARASFPNLKPTTRPISIRIPEHLLVRVKERANELNLPYQAIIKEYIARGVAKKDH